MTLYAPAKVNLYLRVLGKRPDGYHNIETVFEKIALFDKIILKPLKKNTIKISCDHPLVPTGRRSLAYKTARLLKKQFKVRQGVEIKIKKRIPVAAGLGGGSSDAATLLMGLNKLWKLSLSVPRLTEFAKALGSDVPFFLSKSSFAMAIKRGDEVMSLSWRKKFWHLIVSPPIRLFSKDIYSAHKKRRIKKRSANDLNDLEEIVLKKKPLVSRLKDALKDIGVKHSLVSGSGPSVFSLFKRRKEATGAKKLLKRHFPIVNEKGWRIFIVSTL